MKVNRDKLFDFLTQNGCSDVGSAMAPLEGLFKRAESEKYSLLPATEIDLDKLGQAAALAINRPVTKVVPISLSRPFPKPDWMPEEVYIKTLRMSLGDNLITSIGENLEKSLEGRPWNSLEDDLWDSLEENLGDIFGESLRDILGNSLWDSLESSFQHNLWNILVASFIISMSYYLIFCFLNDQEKIARLKPLVEFWSQCWILGFKVNEPETLIVLCQ